MRPWLIVLSTLGITMASGCNDDRDRYEDIKKLRAIGAGTQPVILTPSTVETPQIATVKIYAALPSTTADTQVTASAYLDEGSKFAAMTPITLAPEPTTEAFAALHVLTFEGTFDVPSAEELGFTLGRPFAKLRYGITLTADDEEEHVVGDVLVYPAEAPEQEWQEAPEAAITAPPSGDVVGSTADLSATVTHAPDETVRSGWFVSSGKVKNRRARTTEWETDDSGPQTIIFTARSRRTSGFVMQAVDVTVD